MTDTLRGALLMVLAMGLFSIEDAIIKHLSTEIPTGVVIFIIGIGGLMLFIVWTLIRGLPLWTPHFLERNVLARTGCEMVGTMFFVTALSLIPLTTASAVIQATPLVVAFGAAVFLGQTVGWRRWTAILVGFGGVLLIIRPGLDGFQPATIFAVFGMIGLASRDLITRSIESPITGFQLTLQAYVGLVIAGIALMLIGGQSFEWPKGMMMYWMIAAILMSILAYLVIVAATRKGDAATTSSFRYSRMIYALTIGYLAFGETADWPTLLGVAIVIAAGLYTLIREARIARAGQAGDAAL